MWHGKFTSDVISVQSLSGIHCANVMVARCVVYSGSEPGLC